MKTAHQSIVTPGAVQDAATKQYVTDSIQGELFRWNRTDVSQFTLVDALAEGWAMAYVAAASGVPAHIQITAPPSWTTSAGPAFVLVSSDLSLADHDVIVVHDFLSPFHADYSQLVGPILRYVADDTWIGVQWDPSATPTFKVEVEDGGSPSTIYTSSDSAPAFTGGEIVRTVAASVVGAHGCGRGRIEGMGLFSGSASLHTDPTVGFGLWSLARVGTYGGEILRIFDFVVKTTGGG